MLSFVYAGCNTERTDPRLTQIAEIASSHPFEALDSLKAIDKTTLTEKDRHYHDFLTVKASDKAFIKHTSDSLIMDVIDYYSSIGNSSLYGEASYYGGRVYKDLGDYPTALSFFQKALDIIPQNQYDSKLLGNIYYQTSGLLTQLRLYDEAEKYLKKSIESDFVNNDSLNLLYDLEAMAHLKIRTKQFIEAEKVLKEALLLAKTQPNNREKNLSMHLAWLYHERGLNDSALKYIRYIPERLETQAKYTALSYGSQIFLQADILDTAYCYAHDLAYSPSKNRRIGFNILLSPKIRKHVPLDSIIKFTDDYIEAVEDYLNQNEAKEVSIKSSIYNYDLHLKDKQEIERRNINLQKWLKGIGFFGLVLTAFFTYRQNLYQKKLIRLYSALEKATKLKALLKKKGIIIDEETCEELGSSNVQGHVTPITDDLQNVEKTPQILRQDLRETLVSLSRNPQPIPLGIFESKPYKQIRQWLNENKGIDDYHPFWEEMEEMINHFSPNFKPYLLLLTNGRLTKYEFNTTLLVKCGLSPTEMSQLLHKTISTIGSRRESLGYKIFDQKMSVKIIDNLIRSL